MLSTPLELGFLQSDSSVYPIVLGLLAIGPYHLSEYVRIAACVSVSRAVVSARIEWKEVAILIRLGNPLERTLLLQVESIRSHHGGTLVDGCSSENRWTSDDGCSWENGCGSENGCSSDDGCGSENGCSSDPSQTLIQKFQFFQRTVTSCYNRKLHNTN